jgi:hypothetical protein
MISFKDLFSKLFGGDDDAPVEPSGSIVIRPSDMRHDRPVITVMIKKHKDHRFGKESYDWALKEPIGAMRRFYGTLKKRKSGGWVALATDGNVKAVEIHESKNSLKALRKVYKSISKKKGSTDLKLPLLARGNAIRRSLT